MREDVLCRMANQIARQFAAKPEQAAADTARHLEAFWTPDMIDTLARVRDVNGDTLHPVARAAIDYLRATTIG